MKKILLLLISITAFNSIVYSQIMSLHLLKYEKSMNPLFSKKSKTILVTFDKNSLIDSPQIFNYLFKVDISDRKSELTGVTNDLNISGAVTAINRYGILGGVLASSFNTSKQFSYRNTNGFVILNRQSFDSLINISENLLNIIANFKLPLDFSKSYFYKVDKLELSLEIQQSVETYSNSNGNSSSYKIEKTFFLKIDESVYVFSVDEFKELYNLCLLTTQTLWNNK